MLKGVRFELSARLIKQKIILQYLEHFKNHGKPTVRNHVIVMLDNNESHVNESHVNEISTLTSHPHTSQNLQFLD